jgi:hypothetical protein
MPRKATTALTALLVFGSASAVFADMANRGDSRGFFAEHSVSMVSSDRIAAMNDAAMPFSTTDKESSATSRLALLQKAFFCRGITGTTTVWIKLTEPGGKLIHINLEHVTSVRSATQEPGLNSTWRAGNFRACRKMSRRSCS